MEGIKPLKGKVVRKNNKFWFVNDERYYMIHFWDNEKARNALDTEVEATVFKFRVPQRENQVIIHGWVYPGMFAIRE